MPLAAFIDSASEVGLVKYRMAVIEEDMVNRISGIKRRKESGNGQKLQGCPVEIVTVVKTVMWHLGLE